MATTSPHVGLLLCDHLDPDVAAHVGDYPELFPARFEPAGVRLSVFDVTRGELPDSPEGFDGWMVSGSRRSVYEDEPWIRRLEDLVQELVGSGERLAGICFGHQLVAQALGGRVERAEVGWGVGGRRFEVRAAAPWMEPAPDAFTILMSHQDQVVELPAGAELVAAADYCPVGAYRIGEQVFCVQGHPEFVPQLSEILMRRRRDAIGHDVVDAGLASLEEPLDQDRVAGWIAAFFSR